MLVPALLTLWTALAHPASHVVSDTKLDISLLEFCKHDKCFQGEEALSAMLGHGRRHDLEESKLTDKPTRRSDAAVDQGAIGPKYSAVYDGKPVLVEEIKPEEPRALREVKERNLRNAEEFVATYVTELKTLHMRCPEYSPRVYGYYESFNLFSKNDFFVVTAADGGSALQYNYECPQDRIDIALKLVDGFTYCAARLPFQLNLKADNWRISHDGTEMWLTVMDRPFEVSGSAQRAKLLRSNTLSIIKRAKKIAQIPKGAMPKKYVNRIQDFPSDLLNYFKIPYVRDYYSAAIPRAVSVLADAERKLAANILPLERKLAENNQALTQLLSELRELQTQKKNLAAASVETNKKITAASELYTRDEVRNHFMKEKVVKEKYQSFADASYYTGIPTAQLQADLNILTGGFAPSNRDEVIRQLIYWCRVSVPTVYDASTIIAAREARMEKTKADISALHKSRRGVEEQSRRLTMPIYELRKAIFQIQENIFKLEQAIGDEHAAAQVNRRQRRIDEMKSASLDPSTVTVVRENIMRRGPTGSNMGPDGKCLVNFLYLTYPALEDGYAEDE